MDIFRGPLRPLSSPPPKKKTYAKIWTRLKKYTWNVSRVPFHIFKVRHWAPVFCSICVWKETFWCLKQTYMADNNAGIKEAAAVLTIPVTALLADEQHFSHITPVSGSEWSSVLNNQRQNLVGYQTKPVTDLHDRRTGNRQVDLWTMCHRP